jgi:hypothetical protein
MAMKTQMTHYKLHQLTPTKITPTKISLIRQTVTLPKTIRATGSIPQPVGEYTQSWKSLEALAL